MVGIWRIALRHRILRRFAAARGASAAVEFAMCGIAIFAFFFFILNLGLLGFELSIMARGVQTTGRWAAVQASAAYVSSTSTFTLPCTSKDAATFNNVASSALPLLPTAATGSSSGTVTSGNLSLTATWSGSPNGSPGMYVTMSAVYTWRPIGFNFGSINIPLKIATAATLVGSATVSSASVATSCSA
jgi:hypothetical protein